MKYLIVGGGAGGATAAARLRRNDEQAEIILFEKGKYISYANCGLPYYIGGIIQDREKLFVQTPEIFGKRFNLDVRTESEKRLSVVSLSTSATMISPSSAVFCFLTTTKSPGSIPASIIEYPLARRIKKSPSPKSATGRGTYSSKSSSAYSGCPQEIEPNTGESVKSASAFCVTEVSSVFPS